MTRRLYFLFPDVDLTQRVVDDLTTNNISQEHIHVVARNDIDLGNLPQSTIRQKEDVSFKLERFLWSANLMLFFLAAVAAVIVAIWGNAVWTIIPIAIMVACFISGERFTRIPNVHLSDFKPALMHGEILLMVDIPKKRVHELETIVQRRHPEAVPGGVGWTVEALHI
jgi:hypothetical protein